HVAGWRTARGEHGWWARTLQPHGGPLRRIGRGGHQLRHGASGSPRDAYRDHASGSRFGGAYRRPHGGTYGLRGGGSLGQAAQAASPSTGTGGGRYRPSADSGN